MCLTWQADPLVFHSEALCKPSSEHAWATLSYLCARPSVPSLAKDQSSAKTSLWAAELDLG